MLWGSPDIRAEPVVHQARLMEVLIGAEIDGARTVRASSLQELAQRLYALRAEEHEMRLALQDDGDHPMSLSQHAEP